jgi:uncharacterized protein YgiB involved in biofilm formation
LLANKGFWTQAVLGATWGGLASDGLRAVKRSHIITIGALLGGTAVTLYACSETGPSVAFAFRGSKDAALEQCGNRGIAPGVCADAFAQADLVHRQQAPGFATRAACERETDSKCAASTSVGSDGRTAEVEVPIMDGFLIVMPETPGCIFAGNGREEGGGGCSPVLQALPLYQSQSQADAYRLLASREGQHTGVEGIAGHALGMSAVAVTISRGGFGARVGGGRAGA